MRHRGGPGPRIFASELPRLLDDEASPLSGFFREMLSAMAERLQLLDQRFHQYDLR